MAFFSGTINSTTTTFGFFTRINITYSRVFDFDDVGQYNEFQELLVGPDWATSWETTGGHDATAPDNSPYLKMTNDTPLVTPASAINFSWNHPITDLGVPPGKFVKQMALNVGWIRCDFPASQTIAGRTWYYTQAGAYQDRLATGLIWPGSVINTWYDIGSQDGFINVLPESSASTDNIRFDIISVAWRSTTTPTEVRYDWFEIQIIADDTNTLSGTIDSTTSNSSTLFGGVVSLSGTIASTTSTATELTRVFYISGTIASTTSSSGVILGYYYPTGFIDSTTSSTASLRNI